MAAGSGASDSVMAFRPNASSLRDANGPTFGHSNSDYRNPELMRTAIQERDGGVQRTSVHDVLEQHRAERQPFPGGVGAGDEQESSAPNSRC